jgi:subtilase family serine protease
VDLQTLVTLQGNTHPLARPEFDQGAAPDSLPMERILLVLQRSAEQEAALRTLLDEQQIKSSPNYHMWLTPEQFGEQFGPADADIQAVTDWLTSQGFTVNRVAAGRTVIEFTGTAGTVRQGFHTEIHKYLVNGQEHWGNASDPQIPAALAPVVAGFASLNNFPRKPMVERAGVFSRSKATGEVKPLMTGSSGSYYALGPTDFATIYNVLPLWSAGTDGTGQTIAIVAGSNINISDVENFRTLFGLPANDPQIIVNGVDPGVTMTDGETEADLDTEWSGAVAKNATIVLVVSEDTESTYGADLSAVYIVDNNLAPILSASYGVCEAALGVGGNAFYNALWGQGAAQGITILVASGDSGSAGCDVYSGEVAAEYGLMVSGTASTPYNVAVGGTDFNDVDTWSKYWSSTNNTSTLASALSYIPETTWNDSCARTGVASNCASAESDTPTGIDLVGGGGGASNCVNSTSTSTTLTCMGGYPKPAWQSGNGVPSDGARDLPDVSLFAADGTIAKSFYVVCEADALPAGYPSCNQSYSEWYFLPVGGTSASTPTFAGLMALVNQAAGGRRGNANYVLYPMAAKSGASCTSDASMASTANNSACIFYDVVAGNNSVACTGGSPNCSNTISGGYGILEVNPPSNSSPAWTTTAGYDLATGLGSVNAANLVKNWSSISFQPSTTTLASLSPTNLTHGQTVNFTVNVAPGSGSGALTGNVSLIAQTGVSPTNVTGIGPFALSSGSFSGSSNMLPGGTYGVTAHYPGNGTYGASDSTPPVQVTVSPEGSLTHVALLTFNPTTGQETSSNATSLVYGSSFEILRVDVTNSSGQDCSPISQYSCPTGQVTPTDNGQPLDLGTYKLNSQGFTEDQRVQLPGGTDNIVASYSGDSSYNASTSPADVITITPGPTTTTLSPPLATGAGTTYVLEATINTQSNGLGPTGTVQFLNGGAPIGQPAPVFPIAASASQSASAQASAALSLPVGTLSLTAQYNGDSNYAVSTSPAVSLTVTDYSLTVSPPTITIPAPGQSANATITVAPLGGFTASMNVTCLVSNLNSGINCSVSPEYFNVTGSSAATTTLTITTVGPNSLAPPAPHFRIPPSPRPLVGWPWLLAGLLALATLMSLAAARRWAAGLPFAAALLVVGVWVACGGGGGGGYSPPPVAPLVNFFPSALIFGYQNTGTTSVAQNVTLTNVGNASLSISGIAMGGTNAGDFAQTNTCSSSLAAGTNCTISVTFTPSAGGSRSASLNVTDNASGSPQAVGLTGTGVQPLVILSPGSLAFGAQGVDVASAPQNVTLTNTGSSPVSISSIYTSDGDFSQSNNCPTNVAAGATCTISITFAPYSTGAVNALLYVADNSIGSPQSASLAGKGITAPGTYQLSVEAASTNGSNISHSVAVTVVVQ